MNRRPQSAAPSAAREHAEVVSALLPHLQRTGEYMPDELIRRLAERVASSLIASNRPIPARVA